MSTLSFDSGIKTYTVNDSCEISFSPTSAAFVNQFMNTMDKLQKLQETNDAKQAAIERNGMKAFEIVAERDKRIAEEINGLFGDGVSENLFPWGPSAISGGLPVWLNFFLAVLDEIDAAVGEQKEQADPRLQRYMEKYAKYQKK